MKFTASEVEASCMADGIFDNPTMIDAARHPGRYFIHNSLRSNRESIQADGLKMHEPRVDGNWKSGGPDRLEPGRAIFVFPLGNDPEVKNAYYLGCQYGGGAWGYQIPGHEGEPFDHWLIDGKGIKHKVDPDLNYAVKLLQDVPADRLTLLTDVVDESVKAPAPAPKSLFGSLFGDRYDPYRDDRYDADYGDEDDYSRNY